MIAAHPEFYLPVTAGSGRSVGGALVGGLRLTAGSDRYDSVDDVQKHSTIAPVTETSGKKESVHFRFRDIFAIAVARLCF